MCLSASTSKADISSSKWPSDIKVTYLLLSNWVASSEVTDPEGRKTGDVKVSVVQGKDHVLMCV